MQKRFHEKLKMIENAASATHLVQEALANEATTEGSGDSPKQSATATSISLHLGPARSSQVGMGRRTAIEEVRQLPFLAKVAIERTQTLSQDHDLLLLSLQRVR